MGNIVRIQDVHSELLQGLHQSISLLIQDIVFQRRIFEGFSIKYNGLLMSLMVLLYQYSCHSVLCGKREYDKIFGEVRAGQHRSFRNGFIYV